MVASDLDRAGGIAGVLCVLRWGGRLHDLAQHAARETNHLAIDAGSGLSKQVQRIVVMNHDPDFFEQRVSILLDEGEPFLAYYLERFQSPR